MAVEILSSSFDPWQVVPAWQREVLKQPGKYGATAVFVGTMRDFNEGDDVTALTLEHYPGMTDRYLEKIRGDAMERWGLLDVHIVHRVGDVLPDDPIVLVAVWSAHRAAAFEASRWLMEELKSKAPFWKKEATGDGHRWVEQNTPG